MAYYAWQADFSRLSLETSSMPGFEPARTLYASAGFTESSAFADYAPSLFSTFMELPLQ